MEDFLKYWDEVLEYWVEHGDVPPSESHWFDQEIGLYRELMPEPYLGDPHNCSVVIMNYNPGAPKYDLSTEDGRQKYRKDIVHHSGLDNPEYMAYYYARNYRERAHAGGYLGAGVDPMYDSSCLSKAGKDWWFKRLAWFKELAPESDKLPFAIDLCGWHSNQWGKVKLTPPLLAKLKELMAPVIEEAIRHSDLGVGICVGSSWSSIILPAFGYKDVTAEVMDLTDYKRGRKPLGGERSYCVLRNSNGTYIINTWKTGFRNMDVPKPEFRHIEKEIIDRIKSYS